MTFLLLIAGSYSKFILTGFIDKWNVWAVIKMNTITIIWRGEKSKDQHFKCKQPFQPNNYRVKNDQAVYKKVFCVFKLLIIFSLIL